MSTPQESAVAELYAAIRENSGKSIKYRVGNDDCELTAIPGQSISEQYGDDGVAATARLLDWIIDEPDDLRIDGDKVEPQPDHLILTDDGRCYLVTHSAGENCWRYTDQTRQAIRIHTIEIEPPEVTSG